MNLFAIFLAIATAFVAHASAGCISPEVEFEASPGGPSVLFELQFQRNTRGPLKRHIWIHIPKNYKHNKPSPVILAFHGKGQDVLDFEKATNLSNPIVNQEYVVVYPEGLNVSLRVAPQRLLEPLNCSARTNLIVGLVATKVHIRSYTEQNSLTISGTALVHVLIELRTNYQQKMWTSDIKAPPRSEVNDVEFVSYMIEFLNRFTPVCIDETRIYATGFSNGGGLVGVLACDEHQSQRIAAFAAASGAFYRPEALKEPELAWCRTRRKPIPFLEFHGDVDPVIDYEGVGTPDGETFAIPKWITGKALRNHCDLKKGNITTSLANGAVEKVTWHCQESAGDETIIHYKLKGVGHMWPRREMPGNAENSPAAAPIDATPIILDFFAKHRIVQAANDRDEL